jgi:serine/threonine protein kinase
MQQKVAAADDDVAHLLLPPLQDFDAPLGSGSYGTAYSGRLMYYPTPVAIKLLRQGAQQSIASKAAALAELEHKHLLPLLGWCTELPGGALVHPLMPGGSLRQRLATGSDHAAGPLLWRDRVRICEQVAACLAWLHSQQPPTWHLDLNSSNVLLKRCVEQAIPFKTDLPDDGLLVPLANNLQIGVLLQSRFA